MIKIIAWVGTTIFLYFCFCLLTGVAVVAADAIGWSLNPGLAWSMGLLVLSGIIVKKGLW